MRVDRAVDDGEPETAAARLRREEWIEQAVSDLVRDPGAGVGHDEHDRAEVVRQTLLSAGMDDLDLDRMAATVTLADGSPRFAWTDVRPDHDTYVRVVLESIGQRQRWRVQYEAAKTAAAGLARSVDGVSTVAQPP